MSPLNKQMNEYAGAIAPDLYAAIPKAVFAAIAVSAVFNQGVQLERGETVNTYLVREWDTLHRNGLVPQALPHRFLVYRV